MSLVIVYDGLAARKGLRIAVFFEIALEISSKQSFLLFYKLQCGRRHAISVMSNSCPCGKSNFGIAFWLLS